VVFSFGGSSNEDESLLPQNIKTNGTLIDGRLFASQKEKILFKEEVVTQTI
jgi:hypothetical protein